MGEALVAELYQVPVLDELLLLCFGPVPDSDTNKSSRKRQSLGECDQEPFRLGETPLEKKATEGKLLGKGSPLRGHRREGTGKRGGREGPQKM